MVCDAVSVVGDGWYLIRSGAGVVVDLLAAGFGLE